MRSAWMRVAQPAARRRSPRRAPRGGRRVAASGRSARRRPACAAMRESIVGLRRSSSASSDSPIGPARTSGEQHRELGRRQPGARRRVPQRAREHADAMRRRVTVCVGCDGGCGRVQYSCLPASILVDPSALAQGNVCSPALSSTRMPPARPDRRLRRPRAQPQGHLRRRCRATRWWSSPACPARASRRSRSTRSTPRASAATSSRCRPTRASSSGRWTSPTSTRSRACRRRSRSTRRRRRATRARRSARSPRSTTTCACCGRAIGKPHCHICGAPIAGQSAEQIIDQVMELRGGHALHGAGADRARAQGRVRQAARGAARRGLHAREGRRRAAHARGGDRARQEATSTTSRSSSTGW